MTLEEIAKQIECRYQEQLNRCGLMCRLFSRAKTVASIEHKLFDENSTYLKGTSKIQDIIGIRIVVYFSDDVEVAELLVNNHHVVKRAIDAPDSCTFRPQRLNITCNMSPEFVKDFRAGLPEKYAQYIDDTYEVQVRTIFSEGWHEVEHDLRYKCKETWVGYENYSRTLNGVIASLENAEWSMQSIFRSMAQDNFNRGDFSSMLRNKLRIRLKGNNLSPELETYLKKTPDT
ncbi:MAG: GTP pyrophosphokinase, partial [Bacteroidales bacterium]|nr:GTP pyrophosphokinase [Bacteroidales bacterium]